MACPFKELRDLEARAAPALLRLALSVARTPLEGQLPGYLFGDATVSLPAATNEDLIDVALPADGRWQASLPLPAEALAARTPILASFNASVHETGGRAVNRSISRVLWPAPQLVSRSCSG